MVRGVSRAGPLSRLPSSKQQQRAGMRRSRSRASCPGGVTCPTRLGAAGDYLSAICSGGPDGEKSLRIMGPRPETRPPSPPPLRLSCPPTPPPQPRPGARRRGFLAHSRRRLHFPEPWRRLRLYLC